MIQTLNTALRRLIVSIVVAVQTLTPIGVLAEEANPSDVPPADTSSQSSEGTAEAATEEETAADSSTAQTTAAAATTGPSSPTGPQAPTGASSSTYTFNKATGLWENDYYTWDPATGQTKPKTSQGYSYNPITGMWDTTEWYYSPEQGKYVPNTISSPTNPGPQNSITNTGPNSNNQINLGGTTNGTFDLFFDATISNKIGQMSASGDATVQNNTLGGSALTGDATTLLNLLNMIQSSWGQLGSDDIAMFMANIDGDVVGDLYVDPNGLAAASGTTNIDLSVQRDATIHNEIDVDVSSGNALVNNNTKGGNATSGNASAVVNLLNLINSAIKADKSFVGVLNINGNLDGDILLPPDMLQAIIAHTGPSSNNTINQNNNRTLDVTVADNKTIQNDINTDASSGNASVTGNTSGGDATTGQARSNVVLLNLTGKKVVAKNALLVFVNVLGTWTGLIFDAPAGTNAIAATGPNSNNTIDTNNNLDLEADITKNSVIDNDIDVSAHSGDATVSGNTSGGNAKSGDASIGVNVLNMIDSEFDISDWFGVLFINVFGNWQGSFGVNTEAGNAVGAVTGRGADAPASTDTFTFVPKPAAATNSAYTFAAATSGNQSTSSAVFSAQTGSAASAPATKTVATQQGNSGSNWWVAGIVTLIGALILGGERLIVLIRNRAM